MTTLVLTRGLPASGKSTYAEAWVAEDPNNRARVNRDDLRFATYGQYVLPSIQENNITTAQHAQVTALLAGGVNVIVDDTNLRAATVRDFYTIADKIGSVVEFVDFETPVDECVRRNAIRVSRGGRDVPEDVIRGFASRYTRKGKLPAIPERLDKAPNVLPYDNDPELPRILICDLDGTMAHNATNRGFYDWPRVGEDDLVQSVHDVVNALAATGVGIIFMSGRDAVCRPETTEWLRKHNLPVDRLYMRPEGSMEPDQKVKLDLFNEFIRGKYHVTAVFDDRLSVSRLWHSLGLPLFRVGDPDATF